MSSFSDHLQEALGSAYQLDHELEGGGMSRVFVATDKALDRTVVVKVLPPDLAAGVNRERFRREIQLAAKLQHPHIVPLLSAGEHGDLLWYTMPYIEGESLRAAIERKREFSVREVTRILHDVVDALAYAHTRGVIHRDIKPANILTQGLHALVTDFGVAKALSAALPSSSVTSAGIAIGTPAYMAPEQLAGDPSADHRIDIYAVGLLAYELLTGESPFSSPSPRETLAAQMSREPAQLDAVRRSVPPQLSRLVMRCLAKDPDARPATAQAVLDELDSMTVPISGPFVAPAAVEPPRPARRSGALWVAGGALAVVGAVVVAFVSRGSTNEPTSNGLATAATASRAANDTTPRPGPAGPSPAPAPAPVTPASPPQRQPVVISREDSIAIAEQIAKRVAAARLRDSVKKAKLQDSLQKVMERRFVDSVIAANSRGSTATAPRRVAVIEPREIRTWPEATVIGRAIADSLRRMLSRQRQFVAVPQDSVRAYMAPTPRTPDSISKNLGAELLVIVRLTALPRDSSTVMLDLYDYGASRSFSRRTVTARSGPRTEVLTSLDVILLQGLGYLNEMSRGDRKPPP
jgi:hypothetical protein